MEVPWIANIQRFSVHDGSGIRTTVFFKGCELRCLWCHNPEDQEFFPELMLFEERCNGCGACLCACTQKAIQLRKGKQHTERILCTNCFACEKMCLFNVRQSVGKRMSVDILIETLKKDMPFFESSGGGVTFSGGEVMEQPFDYIIEAAQKLHQLGISLFIDTCGHCSWERFEAIAPYVNTFLFDLKAMNPELHKQLTGTDNTQILSNLRALSRRGTNIHIRLPLIPGLNDQTTDLKALADCIREIQPKKVHLLPYHKYGIEKGGALGRWRRVFEVPTQERIEEWSRFFQTEGIACILGG